MTLSKHDTRLQTIRLLQHTAGQHALLDRAGRLACDWVELAGDRAPTYQLLLDERLLPSEHGRFIGVDVDRRVLETCRVKYATRAYASWLEGDLVPLVVHGAPELANAGVLVFDSWQAARGAEIADILPHLFDFARRQHARAGAGFLFVLNVCLRGVGDKEARRYREQVETHFGCTIPSAAWESYPTASGKNKMLLTRLRFGF